MFQKCTFTQNRAFKVLPKNRIEKQVQKIVHSFNFALHLFFSSKYYVQNNHIYPKGKKYLLLSFCCMLFMNVLYIYVAFSIDATDLNMKQAENNVIVVLGVFCYFIQAICFTVLYILDIVHRNNNVFFILEIQNIHEDIYSKKSMQSYVIWNWVSLLTFISLDIYMHIIYFTYRMNLPFTKEVLQFFCDIMSIVFDVNYIIAIRFIILLKKYLDEWILEILASDFCENSNERCRKLLRVYQNILKAYDMYKIIFQVLVSTSSY